MIASSALDDSDRRGELRFGDILAAAGVDAAEAVVLRHTHKADGLRGPEDLVPERLLEYTRRQGLSNKLGRSPARLWLVFIAEQGLRSRLLCAYDNHGEVLAERDSAYRYFNLALSDVLSALNDRLVINWSRDPVNWAKPAHVAARFAVVEIADREAVAFPGFDRVILSQAELRTMITDSRYASWRTALAAVQGIYLIADTSTGRLYVGKADGGERILGRWSHYARDGHGGNIALRELAGAQADHAEHFQYSLLRVYGPDTQMREVDAAEVHFKNVLLSRQHG